MYRAIGLVAHLREGRTGSVANTAVEPARCGAASVPLPFGVQGSGFGIGVKGSGFRVQGSGCRIQGSGCRVQGSGFRVQGSGCRVQGSGFEFDGSGCGVCGVWSTDQVGIVANPHPSTINHTPQIPTPEP